MKKYERCLNCKYYSEGYCLVYVHLKETCKKYHPIKVKKREFSAKVF
ncbi:MAG: hypothetical protein ACE5WD_11785 [Candidatus Aminicenantia bacterium]